jgi:hypothetical protein
MGSVFLGHPVQTRELSLKTFLRFHPGTVLFNPLKYNLYFHRFLSFILFLCYGNACLLVKVVSFAKICFIVYH